MRGQRGPQHFQIASPNTGGNSGGNRPHDVSLNWILVQFVPTQDGPMALWHLDIVENKIYDSQPHYVPFHIIVIIICIEMFIFLELLLLL